MNASLSWLDVAIRLGLAVAAGFVIGLDRGEHAQPAGLRTTVLITVAAALAMLEANWLFAHMPDTRISVLRLDVMRLPLGILSGIGFIGAGAILRREDMIRGVTTAATLWLVTVIGLCFGAGQIGLGLVGTGIALATLWWMKYAEARLVTGRRGTIDITFTGDGLQEGALLDLLKRRGFVMRSRRVELTPSAETRIICNGRYRGRFPDWSADLMRELATNRGITRVAWQDTD